MILSISKLRYFDGDTDFIYITTWVLQGDKLTPFLFITCLDYVLRKTKDKLLQSNSGISFSKYLNNLDVDIASRIILNVNVMRISITAPVLKRA